MRGLGVALAAGMALAAGGARAADVGRPVAPAAPAVKLTAAVNWTGLYVGGHIGGSAAALPVQWSDDTHWDGLGFRNWEAGAFVGFNHAALGSSWLFGLVGLEGGATWLGLTNTEYDGVRNATIDWMATVDARLGKIVSPNAMLYARFGWGLLGLDIPPDAYIAPGVGRRSLNALRVGVGMEAGLASGWRARLDATWTQAIQTYHVTDQTGLGYKFRPYLISATVGLVHPLGGYGPGTAVAAVPAMDWTGPYVGGALGAAVSDTREHYFGSPIAHTNWDGFGAGNVTASAFAGLNWRHGDGVVGVEADARWLGQRNFDSFNDFTWGAIDWMASIDARAGHLIGPRTLIYAKGGWAALGFWTTYLGPRQSEVLNALQAGAGIETQIAPRMTVRVEGLYTQAIKGFVFYSGSQGHAFIPQIVSGDVGLAVHF